MRGRFLFILVLVSNRLQQPDRVLPLPGWALGLYRFLVTRGIEVQNMMFASVVPRRKIRNFYQFCSVKH